MSAYLARLKQIDNNNFINTPYTEPTEPTKGAFDGFDGSPMAHIVKNNGDSEVISNWWLIHFTDRDPVQVAMWPPCNHAGALASYPKAIAAEPIPSPIDENLNVELMANE